MSSTSLSTSTSRAAPTPATLARYVSGDRSKRLVAHAEYLHGFSELAAFRSSEDERALYRRFRYLCAYNLTFLECELGLLEAELVALDEEDKAILLDPKHPDFAHVSHYTTSYAHFKSTAHEDPRAARRMDLVTRLRSLLQEYQQALTSDNQVQTLPDPPTRCHALLRNFLTRKSGLIMNDGKALLATKTTEVVTTDPGDDNDRISEAVEGLVSRWRLSAFKDPTPPSWGDLYDCSNAKTAVVVTVFNIVATCALVAGAMGSLSATKGQYQRIGVVVGFTLMFASYLAYLTGAKRTEVLASTAAYASVLVIYVGGTTDDSS